MKQVDRTASKATALLAQKNLERRNSYYAQYFGFTRTHFLFHVIHVIICYREGKL